MTTNISQALKFTDCDLKSELFRITEQKHHQIWRLISWQIIHVKMHRPDLFYIILSIFHFSFSTYEDHRVVRKQLSMFPLEYIWQNMHMVLLWFLLLSLFISHFFIVLSLNTKIFHDVKFRLSLVAPLVVMTTCRTASDDKEWHHDNQDFQWCYLFNHVPYSTMLLHPHYNWRCDNHLENRPSES